MSGADEVISADDVRAFEEQQRRSSLHRRDSDDITGTGFGPIGAGTAERRIVTTNERGEVVREIRQSTLSAGRSRRVNSRIPKQVSRRARTRQHIRRLFPTPTIEASNDQTVHANELLEVERSIENSVLAAFAARPRRPIIRHTLRRLVSRPTQNTTEETPHEETTPPPATPQLSTGDTGTLSISKFAFEREPLSIQDDERETTEREPIAHPPTKSSRIRTGSSVRRPSVQEHQSKTKIENGSFVNSAERGVLRNVSKEGEDKAEETISTTTILNSLPTLIPNMEDFTSETTPGPAPSVSSTSAGPSPPPPTPVQRTRRPTAKPSTDKSAERILFEIEQNLVDAAAATSSADSVASIDSAPSAPPTTTPANQGTAGGARLPPGAAPPSDFVVNSLNAAEDFLEVARKLRLFRRKVTQRRRRRAAESRYSSKIQKK